MTERQQTPSYPLRMAPDLRVVLENLAKGHNRSLNAEIITRLEESLCASIDSLALAQAKKRGRNVEAIQALEEAKARIDIAINALTQDSLT